MGKVGWVGVMVAVGVVTSPAFVMVPSAAAYDVMASETASQIVSPWDASDCLDIFHVRRSAGSVLVSYTGAYLPLVGKKGSMSVSINATYGGSFGVSKTDGYTTRIFGVHPYGATVFIQLFEGGRQVCSGYYSAT